MDENTNQQQEEQNTGQLAPPAMLQENAHQVHLPVLPFSEYF